VEGFFVVSVHQARTLRKNMSPTEIRLWRELRLNPGGFKFRRQHPYGEVIFDFFCLSAAVAVEVDGLAHDFAERARHDLRRDGWTASQGVKTLRIPADDVRRNLEGVVLQIVNACLERTPPPPFGRSPSPTTAGEDEGS
jgi:very-short-patch-repair endonuclease